MSAAAAVPLLLLGGGLKAAGALQEGRAKAIGFEQQARLDRQSAAIARDQGEADVVTLRRSIYKTVGAQTAAAAASGGAPSDTMDVIAEANTQGELDVQRRRYNARLDAKGLADKANLESFYGKEAKRAGKLGASAAIFEAASSVYGPRGK